MQQYMKRAIELAKQGVGYVNPNPLVGAVIVKGNRVIGEGYHQACNSPHAEREALTTCKEDPRGGTIYVTLEPCCHTGRTPPCTDAILEAGIARVVIGSRDPNPLVAGKGVALLQRQGVEVVVDFLRQECDGLNQIFFHYIQKKLPFVALKYAMTADGKIATKSGESQWITGEHARAHVHELRNRYHAIMVGSQTVCSDDPLLNCRIEGGASPIRVICDGRLRIPLESQICQTAREHQTIIATGEDPDKEKVRALESLGIELIRLKSTESGLDLSALLTLLGQREIDSVLVEGGSTLHGSFLQQRLCQKLYCYVGPKLFGGTQAASPVGGEGTSRISEALHLIPGEVRCFAGGDILLEYDVGEDV